MTTILSTTKNLVVPTSVGGGIVALLVLATSYLVYTSLYNLFISPLKQFPGPKLNAISSFPYDYYSIRGDGHKYLRTLHQTYGDVVRYRPNELSYIKGTVWKDVWGFRSGHSEFYKADVVAAANGVLGIISSKQDDHRRFRRLLSYAFSNQGLREQEPRIQHHIGRLMDGLAAEAGREVDIMQWFTWMSFDIISDLSLGASFDSVATRTAHPWMEFTTKMLKPSLVLGVLERWGLEKVAMSLIPKSMFDDVLQSHETVVEGIGKRMEARGEHRGDFFDYLLKHDLVEGDEKAVAEEKKEKHDAYAGGITLSELHSTASDIGFAGSDTTSTLLSGIIFQLLRHPSCHRKLVSEIRSSFPFPSKDSITTITISATATPKLPYLDAVIQEALRTYHPTPVFAGRKVPQGGDTVDGVFLPEGTRIIIPPFAAYMSPRNFHSPEKFCPERWVLPLTERPEEFRGDNRDKIFQPFSFGPRNCIGMNLAQAETRLALCHLLWRFDVSKPEMELDEDEWEGWADRQRTWFLYDKGPLKVVLRERGDKEGMEEGRE